MVLIDIACTTLDDALHAEQGGANSLELSIDLAADGLTPSLMLIQNVRRQVQIPVYVILRAHARNFVYSHSEKAAMLADAQAMSASCHGFVVGGLHEDGTFDTAWIHVLAEAFPNHGLTLHRALDHCTNPIETLKDLRGIANRVLASGSLTAAWDGRDTLRSWVQQFGDDYSFVAAGQVNHHTIAALIAHTGVQECHAARAVQQDGIVVPDLVQDLKLKANA